MPFFFVDDQFHNHPKAERLLDAGTLGCQALALWVMCGSQSQFQLSTGLVRHRSAARLMGWSPALTRKVGRLLVEVGLWEDTADDDGAPAWQFHDWLAVQRRSGHAVKNERERRAELKKPEVVEAVRGRDGDWCRYCGRRVIWRANRANDGHGGTYDHVDPHLIVGAVNIVVACFSCNRRKAGRTPEQWKRDDPDNGHLLRPPPARPHDAQTLATNGRADHPRPGVPAGQGGADQGENKSGSNPDQPENRSGPRREQAGINPGQPESQTDSRFRVHVGAHAGGPALGKGRVSTWVGEGSGEGPDPGAGPGRAGLPPPGVVPPEHLLGGIGSPWANHHGPPPDVDTPTCDRHGLDLPCPRCHRDLYDARGP